MKLFNLNICNKKDNNQQIVDLVNTCACDIVTIQESMRALDKDVDPFYDSYNVLKNQTNYQNDFFGAVWVAKTRKNNGVITKDFGGYIEQGNQILTNLPIIQAKNVFFYQEYSTFEDETNFRQNDHPRAFVDAILQVGDKVCKKPTFTEIGVQTKTETKGQKIKQKYCSKKSEQTSLALWLAISICYPKQKK